MYEPMDLEPISPKRGPNKLLIGCLGAIAVLAVLGIVGMLYVKKKIVEFISTELHAQVVTKINDSALPDDQKHAFVAIADRFAADLKAGRIDLFDKKSLTTAVQGAAADAVGHLDLPAEQKTGILTQVDRVAEGYKTGQISDEQLNQIFEKLADGPFAGALVVWGVEATQIYGSSLSDPEQQDASLQLRRVLRGYTEGKITEAQLAPHWEKISEPDPDNPGERRLKTNMPVDELREFIAGIKKQADAASVPDEMYKVDFAGEMKKAVDSVIGAATPGG